MPSSNLRQTTTFQRWPGPSKGAFESWLRAHADKLFGLGGADYPHPLEQMSGFLLHDTKPTYQAPNGEWLPAPEWVADFNRAYKKLRCHSGAVVGGKVLDVLLNTTGRAVWRKQA